MINSHPLLQDAKSPRLLCNGGDDATPVMGDGFCPIYDAALVGDWIKLVQLCEDAVRRRNRDSYCSQGDGGGDNEQGGGDEVKLRNSRVKWIESLDVL